MSPTTRDLKKAKPSLCQMQIAEALKRSCFSTQSPSSIRVGRSRTCIQCIFEHLPWPTTVFFFFLEMVRTKKARQAKSLARHYDEGPLKTIALALLL